MAVNPRNTTSKRRKKKQLQATTRQIPTSNPDPVAVAAQELVDAHNAEKASQPTQSIPTETTNGEMEAWQKELKARAQKAEQVLANNGTGGERKNIPFRPYEDTRNELAQLALDLTVKNGELTKVHDLLIEGVNLVFAKYGVKHVAKRPIRAKK